ncbi:hypothetical protein ACOSQ3_018461 [Xanthoceras sorbifolium]
MARGIGTCSKTTRSRDIPSVEGPLEESHQPPAPPVVSNAPGAPTTTDAAPISPTVVPIAPTNQSPVINLPAIQLHPRMQPRSHDQVGMSDPSNLSKMMERQAALKRQAELERIVAEMSRGYHLPLQNHPPPKQIVESTSPPHPARDDANRLSLSPAGRITHVTMSDNAKSLFIRPMRPGEQGQDMASNERDLLTSAP